jgi:hypothetical protein
MSQPPHSPDVEAQRAAMTKLNFLVGKWSGEARILTRPDETLELIQTEEAQYRLDGLILMIEGIGRTKDSGKPALSALGILSYEDVAGTYRMRAYNDGRWLETDVKLVEGGKGITWGFVFGEVRTNSLMLINEKGEWTELTELMVGALPARKFMELRVAKGS